MLQHSFPNYIDMFSFQTWACCIRVEMLIGKFDGPCQNGFTVVVRAMNIYIM